MFQKEIDVRKALYYLRKHRAGEMHLLPSEIERFKKVVEEDPIIKKAIHVVMFPFALVFALVLAVLAKLGSEKAKQLLFYFAEDEVSS